MGRSPGDPVIWPVTDSRNLNGFLVELRLSAATAVALCLGVVVLAWEKGGFFEPANAVALAAFLVVVAAVIGLFRLRLRTEEAFLLALDIWWLVTAELNHDASSFLPLGASFAALLCGSLGVRALEARWRAVVRGWVVVVGSLTAASGLFACAMRWYPLAMRGQNLWRLSGTLTYSNAAGLLLGMALVLCLGNEDFGHLSAVPVMLCTAGLVATQSRGAMLATAVAALLLLRHQIRTEVVPLLVGALAGIVTVASSSGPAPAMGALVATCAALGATCLISYCRTKRGDGAAEMASTTPRCWPVALRILAALSIVLAAYLGRNEIVKRVDFGSILARLSAWRLAIDQWRTSPFLGVGPDKVLVPRAGGVVTYFVHNEYLQVLAGAGVIGALLLLSAVVLVGRRLWRQRTTSSGSVAAVVVFAIAGLFDFVWHVPVLALCAGIALGATAPDSGPSGGGDLFSARR